VEAGAEARYLKDALDKMLGCPAYLDSSTLADLRELFDGGVAVSEVLVLMLSKGLLTRPWCLLEIREAVRLQKPIVLLHLKGPGQSFSFDDAFALLDDLETNLPPLNPWAIGELRPHLGGDSLRQLQVTVRHALEVGRAAMVPHLNINGTANALESELVDLVERMAATTGRTVEWQGGSMLAEALARRSAQRKMLRQRTLSRLRPMRTRSKPVEREGVYILHEPAAEEHALRLKTGIGRASMAPACNMTVPTSTDDIDQCLARVERSELVLLLQTASVLSQPWALLAAYSATRADVSVACVVVEGGGYAFGEAKEHLEHLSERLDAGALELITRALQRRTPPTDLRAMQTELANLIPHIISVVYDPDGTANALAATVRDVRDKQGLLQRGRRRSSFAIGSGRSRIKLRTLSDTSSTSPPVAPQDKKTFWRRRISSGTPVRPSWSEYVFSAADMPDLLRRGSEQLATGFASRRRSRAPSISVEMSSADGDIA